MIYDIVPVAKPRQTRADKWLKRAPVLKYRAFADEVRFKKVHFENGMSITFWVPMPKTWPLWLRSENDRQGKQSVPDVDNYLKALLDAIHKDDSHIWHVGGLKKIWIDGPGAIEIFWA